MAKTKTPKPAVPAEYQHPEAVLIKPTLQGV